MRKSKKVIILISVLALVLLFGATAGVVLAQGGSGSGQDMLDRVAQILGITKQKLADAFKQAQTEFEAQRLSNLVKDGKITQAQADQLNAWEAAKPGPKADKEKFEAWLKAKPKIPALEPPPRPSIEEMLANLVKDGKITQAQADQLKAWEATKPDKADKDKFEAWLKARPDVPLPKPENPPGCGFPHGGGFPPVPPSQ